MIRILLADDHALVRAGLRAILEGMQDVEVVAEAADGREALRTIEERRPDIAILDITMPGLNGLEVAARVRSADLPTRCLLVSMHVDDEYIRRALEAGAAGYLLKDSDRHELEMAVLAVAQGKTWLTPEVSQRIGAAFARRRGPASQDSCERLTPRQREVLKLIAEGLSTKEIAQRLDLSVKTVENHRSELMQRLDIHGVAGLVRYAVRVGIVSSSG